ncbi:MAG: VWA domain-containing protein [Salinibacterium sp.]|nr:VWA domain-containing protein [Salinibacterium sp.]
MIANPVLPGWALAGIAVVLGGFALWRLVASRRDRVAAGRWLARLAMIVLLIVIASRPTIPTDGQGPKASGGLEVYVVVDTTSSMAAEDWGNAQPRLDGVKADVEKIVDALVGAQFSLVTFDAVAVQRVPLTTDSSAMISAVSVVRQEVTTYSRGSSIDVAVPRLQKLLSEAQALAPDQRRVLFYLGDGEQTASLPPGSFAELAPYLNGGAVLGYGTTAGARMLENLGDQPTRFGDTATGAPTPTPAPVDTSFIQDYSGSEPVDAVSRIDETALKSIADELGLTYVHRASDSSVLPALAGIDVGELTIEAGEPDSSVELYWIFVIPFGILVLLELFGVGALVLELRGGRRNR